MSTQPETPVAWRWKDKVVGAYWNMSSARPPSHPEYDLEPLYTADAIASAYRRGLEDAAQVAETRASILSNPETRDTADNIAAAKLARIKESA
mgnify:CR=1 FL=1